MDTLDSLSALRDTILILWFWARYFFDTLLILFLIFFDTFFDTFGLGGVSQGVASDTFLEGVPCKSIVVDTF